MDSPLSKTHTNKYDILTLECIFEFYNNKNMFKINFIL